jgi:hypothetical protein
MWFDVAAALATLNGGETVAEPFRMTERNRGKVAEVARIAAPVDLQLDDEAAILVAIMTGVQRPGAIATATKIGATRVYQLLDQMRDAGRIKMARDGRITAKRVR